jgi:hypothetical protein
VYLLLLLVGAFGFVAMTLLGLGHNVGGLHHAGLGGHAPSTGQGHIALAHHGHTGVVRHGGAQPHHQGSHLSDWKGSVASKLLLAISPLDVFSLCLGAGATGILLRHLVPNGLVWFAIFGAIFFDFAVVKPLIGLMARFVTKPSAGLEGEVAKPAEAISAFDSSGKGLVKLNLDGQVVQLLANLDANERERGVSVSKGDTVLVIEVDTQRNSCRVSRELASQVAGDAANASTQTGKR